MNSSEEPNDTTNRSDEMMSKITERPSLEELNAIRKEAGLSINPDTAKLHWKHGQLFDPYGDLVDRPDECDCISRLYFARSPDSGIWVEFGDLPKRTRDALRERMDREHPSSKVFVDALRKKTRRSSQEDN